MLLRIEDLDVPRCKPEFIQSTIHDLLELGLTWDNEEIMYQSKRSGAYQEALEILQEQHLIYPCFCSRADLLAASAPHAGERSVYTGTCRNLSAEVRAARAASEPHALRCAVEPVDIQVEDLFQRRYAQNLSAECGDFIVARKDDLFSYQMAVTVDDLAQGVNTVIRGIDLLSSAPQQLYLRSKIASCSLDEAAEQVRFGHLPLIVNPDGRRLAKRAGDRGLATLLLEFGSVPHLLGWLSHAVGLIDFSESITAEELVKEADLSCLKGKESISISELCHR